ncbi:hypothetical protein LZ30DRAFT_778332 [Colletotrichum cereale]|nr:hypothetical protein LZ30DRAFT_778332 [Colletotrichum cereale]
MLECATLYASEYDETTTTEPLLLGRFSSRLAVELNLGVSYFWSHGTSEVEASRRSRIPPFEFDNDGKIKVAPGEVYCRVDCGDGYLCHRTVRFAKRQSLVKHLLHAHGLEVVASANGALSRLDNQRQVQYYHNMKRLALGHATDLNTPEKAGGTRRTSTKCPVIVDKDGNPNLARMKEVAGHAAAYKCPYCTRADTECPPAQRTEKCVIWAYFRDPEAAILNGDPQARTPEVQENDEEVPEE